jgi:hypothetical protein
MNLKVAAIAVLIFSAAFVLGAAVNQGPEQIDINTGSNGWVPFPHRAHQKNLVDCNICHQFFLQEKESILRLKSEGQLKSKQIMKDLCIQCHKDRRKAGKAGGPTSCSQCHTKR